MSGGGSDPVTTEKTTTQEWSPEQRQILEPLVPIFQKFGTTPLKQFPGSTIPDFSATELQAQQTALGQAEALKPNIQGALDFSSFLQGDALFPETNPALRASIDAAVRPLTEQFTQSILPNIRGSENVAGQVGGSRGALAEQQASTNFLRQVGDTSAGMVSENFQNALRQGTQSLFTQPALQASSLLPAQIQAGVGGAERGLKTGQLQEEARRFGAEQLSEFAPASAAASVAFGMPGGSTRSTSTAPAAPGGGMFSSALGGGALGAAMFAANPVIGGGLGILAGLMFGGR
jgi:hypothetical protein